MSAQKLTPWFPGEVKPVREGVYQRDYRVDASGFAYWSGSFWGWGGASVYDALKLRIHKSPNQNYSWRGLASNPKGKS